MGENITSSASSVAELRELLEELADERRRDFNTKLVPTEPAERVLGIPVPVLRRIARSLWCEAEDGRGLAAEFLADLPHLYLEEDMLHMFLLNQLSTASQYTNALDHFLPHATNWMVTDAAGPKLSEAELRELEPHLRRWLESPHTYTSRTGGILLMANFLDSLFHPEHFQWIARIPGSDYYTHMLQGWYFATALAKQPDATWPVLLDPHSAGVPLSVEARLKAIQKGIESRRISNKDKEELRKLRKAVRATAKAAR